MKHSRFSIIVSLCALSLVACTPSSNQTTTTDPTTTSGSTAETDAAAPTVTEQPDAAPAESVADAASAEATPEAAAPSVVYAGLRTLALRSGARPPLGAAGRHGATMWTVILAASSGPAPELTALFTQVQQARVRAALGEVTCSPSAEGAYPAAIPQTSGALMLSVNFRNERDARAFAAALAEQPLWIGRARVMCAD